MFKHILVPIDGSDQSKQAMHKAVGMAKEMGAKVTGFHVVP
jgi:nucleotide-binding universal stress UspA family protein